MNEQMHSCKTSLLEETILYLPVITCPLSCCTVTNAPPPSTNAGEGRDIYNIIHCTVSKHRESSRSLYAVEEILKSNYYQMYRLKFISAGCLFCETALQFHIFFTSTYKVNSVVTGYLCNCCAFHYFYKKQSLCTNIHKSTKLNFCAALNGALLLKGLLISNLIHQEFQTHIIPELFCVSS